MDWMQTIAIVGSIAGFWHVFTHTTNAIREDMKEHAARYDAEAREFRKLWSSILKKSYELEKKSAALEKESRLPRRRRGR